MSLTTVIGLKAGMLPAQFAHKQTGNISASSQLVNYHWGSGLRPSPIQVACSAGVAGEALTAPFAGAFAFTNPASGETLVAQMQTRQGAPNASAGGPPLLVDRLWQNSGLDRTLTSAQTVNSVAWPARDANESTNGEGVYIGVEISTGMGTGTPSLSMTYTNSAGTSGKVAANIATIAASSAQAVVIVMGLEAGDTGVRSVQDFTNSVSWGASGALQLVAFRPIAMLRTLNSASEPRGKTTLYEDATTLSGIRIANSSCLQLWGEGGNTAHIIAAQLTLSQG